MDYEQSLEYRIRHFAWYTVGAVLSFYACAYFLFIADISYDLGTLLIYGTFFIGALLISCAIGHVIFAILNYKSSPTPSA